MTSQACLVCEGADLSEVLTLADVPVVCNALAADAETARAAPTGTIALVQCNDCGLVFNRAFDPGRMVYAAGYENALHHSPRFQAFADKLAADLVSRYGLAGQRIVEIGCGNGFMLSLLRRHGVGSAIGFDPSLAGRANKYQADGVTLVPAYFDPAKVDGSPAAILCRHVLEHLPDPLAMLTRLRQQVGDDSAVLYVEVPNADWMLDAVSIWDVIYEHVTCWSAPAIETLMRRAGFAPHVIETGYGEQFLQVHARPTQPDPGFRPSGLEVVRTRARRFAQEAEALIGGWRERLAGVAGNVIIWGAGSKGITFTSILEHESSPVVALIDLNPRKHGLHTPKSALPVLPPERMADLAPEVVLISNGHYETEIRAAMARIGIAPEIGIITR